MQEKKIYPAYDFCVNFNSTQLNGVAKRDFHKYISDYSLGLAHRATLLNKSKERNRKKNKMHSTANWLAMSVTYKKFSRFSNIFRLFRISSIVYDYYFKINLMTQFRLTLDESVLLHGYG